MLDPPLIFVSNAIQCRIPWIVTTDRRRSRDHFLDIARVFSNLDRRLVRRRCESLASFNRETSGEA